MSTAIIDKYQSAYLPHRSTETALTMIINYILIYLDNKAPLYLVLYLSNDFNTLYNNIISIGLDAICIHSQDHSWFMYFVSFRTSSVKINSSLSPPYFYIHMYVNMDFHKYPKINYHLYADDLQRYIHFLV